MLRNGVRQLLASRPVRWLLIAPAVSLLLYGVSAAALWGLTPEADFGPPPVTSDYRPWPATGQPPLPATAVAADWPAGDLDLGEPLGPQPDSERLQAMPTPTTTRDGQGVALPSPTARVIPPPAADPAGKATAPPSTLVSDGVDPTDSAPPPALPGATASVPPPVVIPTNTLLPPPTLTYVPPTLAPTLTPQPWPTLMVPTHTALPTVPIPTAMPLPTLAPPTNTPLPPPPSDTPLPPPSDTVPPPEPEVTLCHRPPGNPDRAHTTVVKESEVPSHLAHGDSLGPCP